MPSARGNWCTITLAKATDRISSSAWTRLPLMVKVKPGTGVGVGVGVEVGVSVGVAVGAGVGVGRGVAVGVGAGVGVGVGKGVGAGAGVGVDSGPFMVRAKMLKLSTWAWAVEVLKSTVVSSGVQRLSSAL